MSKGTLPRREMFIPSHGKPEASDKGVSLEEESFKGLGR